MSFLPFIKVMTDNKIMIKVVNLIPPPVDVLPAPLNINKSINSTVDLSNPPISTELNPAVRVVTAWK